MTDSETASARPSGQRARYSNGERRREDILDAAIEVIAERGSGTSLREIASRAGTSHVSLMHHFGSKEVMLQRVLERRFELDNASREEDRLLGGITEAAMRMMRRNALRPTIVRLDLMITAEAVEPEHPSHDYVLALHRDFVREVVEDLQREQEAGRLRAGLEPVIVARQLLAIVTGIQAQWLYDRDVSMEEHMKAFLGLLRP